ncbi:GIY-YIG nuclease family protein [Pseudomonas sp.]|uniref:GIY-YIG nuclease family protein n=1 Tax=Pseudomonas sp. TaxID=306 RepID=UPI003FD852A7
MKWNYDKCAAIAAKFSKKVTFRTTENSAFQWLKRNNLIGQACAHMVVLRRDLSDADIQHIAGNYQTRRAFKLGDQSAYKSAIKRGILDCICVHMTEMHRSLTDDELREIASQFATRLEFLDADNGAYQTAKKREILDSICSHMDGRNGTRRLSDEEILNIALQYETRNDFKLGDFGAYTTAIRRNLITQACEHMGYGFTGFREDQPAVLYEFRMVTPDGMVLYKIGITNRTPHQRLATMGLHTGVKAELANQTDFESGRDARIAEKRLHRRMAEHRYTGSPVMRNGNTELFTVGALN